MRKIIVLGFILIISVIFIGCVTKENETFSLSSLDVVNNMTKTTYEVGQNYNFDGIKIEATFSSSLKEENNKVEDVTSQVTYDKITAALNDKKIIASYTYEGVTLTCDISVTVNSSRQLLPSDGITVSVPSDGVSIIANSKSGDANSKWFTEYTDDAFYIKALVFDDNLTSIDNNYFGSDGVGVFLFKEERSSGLADGTLRIVSQSNGNTNISKYENGSWISVNKNSLTIVTKYVSLDGVYVDGYLCEISVPYSLLNVTKNDKNITFYPIVYNYDKPFAGIGSMEGYEAESGSSNTYIHVSQNNTYKKNAWLQLGYVFGNTGSLTTTSGWDLSHDDGTENAYIELNSVSGDNNAYMYKVDGSNLYAKVSLSAKEVLNNEKYGKFGMLVTDTLGVNGFFFFIDAAGNGNTMDATNVSIVNKENGEWKWGEKVLANLSSSAAYQNNNYVELAVYRQNDIFVLYLNGARIATMSSFPGLTASSKCSVGLVSFNILIKATNYLITDDESVLEQHKVEKTNISNLFIGDSYIDIAFWNNFKLDFPGEENVNLGVGGTKTAYWDNQLSMITGLYNPHNIIIHIGVNDINDGNIAGSVVLDSITSLISKIRESLPLTNIYFITIEPNNFRVSNYPQYKIVNNGIKALSDNDNFINVIDTASLLGEEAGTKVIKYFGIDGLHYNSDGYALWAYAIKESLGVERLGDIRGLGDSGNYYYSSGFNDNSTSTYIENLGTKEQQIYFSEVNSVNFSVGASIYVGSNTASDNFPKVGFKIKGDNKEVFFFIDVNASRNNNWGNYVVRPQGQDWIWAETEGIRQYVFLGDTSYNKNYKDLELIKVGSAIYFVSDGKVVQYAEGLFSEDEKVVVGILAFNLNLRIQNVFQASSGLEFENKLSEYKISAKEGSVIDGDISDWSSESLQNPLLIPTINNKNIKVYAYLEVDGIYIAYDALHDKYVNNKESWYENTNAEFRLEDSVRRYLNSKGTYSRHEIDSSCADVGYGKIVTTGGAGAYHSIAEIFIPWAMTPWSYSTKLTVAGGFAWKTETETIFIDGWINNDFVYTVEADPTVKSKIITREGFYKGEDLVIDGNLDDWDNTIISSSLEGTNLNRNYQTNMFLGSDGLYGYVKITTNNPLNLSDFSNSWSVNENIEFWINNADPSVRAFIANNIIYSSGFISSIAYTYNNSTKELLFEFFVVYSNIPGYINSDSVVTIRLGCASIDGGWFMPINTDTVVNSLGLSV